MIHELLYPPLDKSHRPTDIPHVLFVGGKAMGLYWLAVHGYPADPIWVLSTDVFTAAIERARVMGAINEITLALERVGDDWRALQHVLMEIEPVSRSVMEALQNLPHFPLAWDTLQKVPLSTAEQWAVRSSATVEDGPQASFAGQFHSVLSVRPYRLWDSICAVWASTFNPTVLAYYARQYMRPPHMAVILQAMEPITAQDRSGVVFSRSPVPNWEGVVIQTTFGSGYTVVSGYGGDLYNVSDGNVTVQQMPPAQIEVSGPEGRMVKAPTPEGKPLTEAEAIKLAEYATSISERWGGDVDVEFIWRAGRDEPNLVQVRSATGLT